MKRSKKTKFNWLWLFLVIFIGLVIRLWKWPNYLNFDFEKARDLVDSLNIFTSRKLTLLGPTTEVDGIFHGPLYYYILGAVGFLAKGAPWAGSIISFSFNLFSIGIIYYFGCKIFNRKIGLLAALLYAISFESISYAYWLSNPGPSVPFIFLMFFFFYQFINQKSTYLDRNYQASQGKFLALSLFCFGMTIQFQILNIIFLPALLIIYLLSKKPKIGFQWLIYSFLSFLLPLSSYILFDVRHGFLMTKNFIAKMLLPHLGGESQIWLIIKNYPLRFFNYFSTVLAPASPNGFFGQGGPASPIGGSTQNWLGFIFALLILWTIIFLIRKENRFLAKFFLVWLFSTFPIFLLASKMGESTAAFIGVVGAVVLVFAYFLNWLWGKTKIITVILLILIFASNIYAVNFYLTNPQKRLFDNFQGTFLKTDLALVDYVYSESKDKSFKVDGVTSPLLVSKLWDYLFEWRGRTKFNTLPILGDEAQNQFLILEPSVDEYWKKNAMMKADQKGELVDSKYFGQVVIQKRIKK